MANVAVRGQPVQDPWLTWSTPEYGEGFWPVDDEQVNAYALAAQSIPDILGPGSPPYPVGEKWEGGIDPAVQALIDAETRPVALHPVVAALIAAEKKSAAPTVSKPAYYGATTTWEGDERTFTGTLAGWGLIMRNAENKIVPTVRTGRLLFGTGLVAGLIWGFAGRDY